MRPATDEAVVDPRDVPGTRSFRRNVAKDKGWDE
jgi:hypothetical protein